MRALLAVMAVLTLTQAQTCGSSSPNLDRHLDSIENVVIDIPNQVSFADYLFEAGEPGVALEVGNIDIVSVSTCEGGDVEFSIHQCYQRR